MFDSAIDLLLQLGMGLVGVLLVLGLVFAGEYVRWLWNRGQWMRQHGHLIETVSPVVRVSDGTAELENGLELDCPDASQHLAARYALGDRVRIVGYPSMLSWGLTVPVTTVEPRAPTSGLSIQIGQGDAPPPA